MQLVNLPYVWHILKHGTNAANNYKINNTVQKNTLGDGKFGPSVKQFNDSNLLIPGRHIQLERTIGQGIYYTSNLLNKYTQDASYDQNVSKLSIL